MIVIAITLVRLYPYSITLEQHGDEAMYIWKAAHFSQYLAGNITEPSFSAITFWAIEQPWGSHSIYALTLYLSGMPAPDVSWSWSSNILERAESAIPAETLPVVRLAAIICAAIGLALITWRFHFSGAVGSILFLAIPHIPSDLARAWAEGPLLFGLGLCAVFYRTRLFSVACGTAAAFKLTALSVWALLFIPGANGKQRPWMMLLSIMVALLTWSLFTPYSWLAGGPLYLVLQLGFRITTFFNQSNEYGGPLGFFMPTRYLWPFELAMLLVISNYFPRFVFRRNSKRFHDIHQIDR